MHTHAQANHQHVLNRCTHTVYLHPCKIDTTCWDAKYSFYSCKNNASLQPAGLTKSTETKTLNGDKWRENQLLHILWKHFLCLCHHFSPLEGMCITLETLFIKIHFISYSYVKHNLQ